MQLHSRIHSGGDMKNTAHQRGPRDQKAPQGDWSEGASVTELIRNAEKHIAAKKYSFALEQLMTAQKLEPRNSYIQAIIYRIQHLQTQGEGTTAPLEVTVGAEFQSGIKGPEDVPVPSDLTARVRQLTALANNYLEHGSLDFAFESLMKAFLLDPTSPHVLACEKEVLPAWEKARTTKRRSATSGGFASLHP